MHDATEHHNEGELPVELPPYDDLVAFIESCSAYLRRDASIRVLERRQREFNMTFGCCVQTIRYAESYLLLARGGYSSEARTLARAALEHAATVEYAYLSVDGLDQLAAVAEHSTWSLMERMRAWGRLDEDAEVPEEPTGTRLPRMTGEMGILARLDPGRVLLDPGYAILSQSVHVTNQTVSQFFRVVNVERMQLRLRPDAPDELPQLTVYVLAAACMLVTWIFAHVREDDAELQRLDRISDELILPIRLDGAWPPEQRTHLDPGAA